MLPKLKNTKRSSTPEGAFSLKGVGTARGDRAAVETTDPGPSNPRTTLEFQADVSRIVCRIGDHARISSCGRWLRVSIPAVADFLDSKRRAGC